MLFQDRLTLDAPRRTRDGYLAVRARAARTGVYEYSGREVDPGNAHGLRDQAVVRVLRDDNTVFDSASVQSFIGKPVTEDHPRTAVTAENWRDHARGTIMGALRDGDYLAFDLLVTDADAIAKIDAGKRELSNGYDANLEFGDFRDAQGGYCQARQARIGGNHVALVKAGRAGSECRIADAAICDAAPRSILDSLITQEKPVKTYTLDGLTVDLANADIAASTCDTLKAQRDEARAKLTDADAKVATLTAEKVALEQKVKDGALTPQQLRDAAASFGRTVDKAKALGVTVTDAMDEPAIRKAVVDAKLGDDAKSFTPEQTTAAFAVLSKDVKVEDRRGDPLRDAIMSGPTGAVSITAVRDAARMSA